MVVLCQSHSFDFNYRTGKVHQSVGVMTEKHLSYQLESLKLLLSVETFETEHASLNGRHVAHPQYKCCLYLATRPLGSMINFIYLTLTIFQLIATKIITALKPFLYEIYVYQYIPILFNTCIPCALNFVLHILLSQDLNYLVSVFYKNRKRKLKRGT